MKNFASDPSGATAIEYTMIAMLIAVVIIGALTTIGTRLNLMLAAVVPGLQ